MEDLHLTTVDHLEDLHHIMEDNIVNRIKPHTLQRITIRLHIKPHKIIIKPHTLQLITIKNHIKPYKITIKPHIKLHKAIMLPHMVNLVNITPLLLLLAQLLITLYYINNLDQLLPNMKDMDQLLTSMPEYQHIKICMDHQVKLMLQPYQ